MNIGFSQTNAVSVLNFGYENSKQVEELSNLAVSYNRLQNTLNYMYEFIKFTHCQLAFVRRVIR